MSSVTPKRLLRLISVMALIPVIAAAVIYVKWITIDNRMATITAGTLYQSAAFAPAELVTVCHEYGIRTVIDLRNEAPEAVHAAAKAATDAGITHINLSTLSHPILSEAHAFLDVLAEAETPVLVHCQHGEFRSVMMCAIHRIQNEGWTNAEAFDGTARLPEELRFLNGMFPSLRRFGAEQPKGRFVLNYKPKGRPLVKRKDDAHSDPSSKASSPTPR